MSDLAWILLGAVLGHLWFLGPRWGAPLLGGAMLLLALTGSGGSRWKS